MSWPRTAKRESRSISWGGLPRRSSATPPATFLSCVAEGHGRKGPVQFNSAIALAMSAEPLTTLFRPLSRITAVGVERILSSVR